MGMMAGLDLHAVRLGLAAAAENATGIKRTFPYVPNKISSTDLPAAYVGFPDQVEYSTRFGKGAVRVTIPVTIVVANIEADDGQEKLDAFLSNVAPVDEEDPIGLQDAIQADRTLGGACSTLVVSQAVDARAIESGTTTYLAMDIDVVVVR
jgi:hypothetical protein